jgi:selenocysteine lyase/cysteine desulfurase
MAAGPSQDKDIRKFEEIGTHPAAMHNGILEALAFYEQIGVERKWARQRYLKERWARRLEKSVGAKMLARVEPEHSGAFATVHVDGADSGKLGNVLLDKYNILVTPIGGPGFDGLRVTPNVYTSVDEIDQFASAVEEIMAKRRADVAPKAS